MVQRVRGVLFVDYVRMIRGRKDVDWKGHLATEDLPFLTGHIDPNGWYPMASFERFGVAILDVIAGGQLEGVRMWGRFQVDVVTKHSPMLLVPGDPRDTLMRFDVLAATFFDQGALRVDDVDDGHAIVKVKYGMSPRAEETASVQSLGFFERLVELSGGRSVNARFKAKAWESGGTTLIELHWDPPGDADGAR